MKAISIKQPWASLIAHGIKDIENRTWACPKKYIGKRVLIHAGKALCRKSIFETLTTEQYKEFRGKVGYSGLDFLEPKGSIIGSVEIVDCVINHPSVWAEKTPNYVNGLTPKVYEDVMGRKIVYNWVLANPVLFEKPIPAKGKLSFWDFDRIKEVKIECPECGSIEIAVEDYTTAPFPTYLHSCNKCGYVIMESEWDVVEEGGNQ